MSGNGVDNRRYILNMYLKDNVGYTFIAQAQIISNLECTVYRGDVARSVRIKKE